MIHSWTSRVPGSELETPLRRARISRAAKDAETGRDGSRGADADNAKGAQALWQSSPASPSTHQVSICSAPGHVTIAVPHAAPRSRQDGDQRCADRWMVIPRAAWPGAETVT